MQKNYISTSIAYINAPPHIGFLLELVAADVLARYQRQIGNNVFFLTGTDEHGVKIQQAIEVSGEKPQEYANEISDKFEQVTKDFDISNDFFIRTTNPKHIEFVQGVWQKLEKAGVLKKKSYDGFYCTGCEAFKTEREIVDGDCVIHEKPVERVSEENWFLIILDDVKRHINGWLEVVEPIGRRNEAISSLKDFNEVSVSRPKSKLNWGVPVPGDDDQTMYVWVDALFNYISGIELSGRKIEDFWPADIQIIGKDILKFHAIIWPALLLACGYELPKKLLVHGFVHVEGKKMSKSLGNVITPAQLKERYGVDATRYLILRQLNFYDDSNFSWSEFDAIYNGELANGLGNLAARTIGLLQRLPDAKEKVLAYVKQYDAKPTQVGSPLREDDFTGTLQLANQHIKQADVWITEQKPWTWSNEQWALCELAHFSALGDLIKASILLDTIMPSSIDDLVSQLKSLETKQLFPRLEIK